MVVETPAVTGVGREFLNGLLAAIGFDEKSISRYKLFSMVYIKPSWLGIAVGCQPDTKGVAGAFFQAGEEQSPHTSNPTFNG